MSRSKISAERKAECRRELLKILRPGDTVYTILRHVSKSGMFRKIDLCVFRPRDGRKIRDGRNPEPSYLSVWAADLLGMTFATRRGFDGSRRREGNGDGIPVSGCGMDMGFHLVYNLGAALWPKGTPKPHSTRNGEPDRDGGYALNHRWL